MYSNSEASERTSSNETKYTVADILTRLSNGEAITPTATFAESTTVPTFVSSITSSGTTPTLTPTTLANIEQSFIDFSYAPTSTTNTEQQPLIAQDLSRQSGFVPPVIHPTTSNAPMGIKTEYYSDDYGDSEDSDWLPPSNKKMRGSEGRVIEITPNSSPAHSSTGGPRRHTGPRPRRNENLTPEEQQKRTIRRERNKVAAAKCRQRRVDHTNLLINETENLEEEKATLENEIQTLQQQKEQLEFLLKAHKPMCSAKLPGNGGAAASSVVIKAEPPEGAVSAATSTRPNTLHLVNTTAAQITASKTIPAFVNSSSAATSVTEATGITISTPSTGVFNTTLSLDIMTDGHTGLTPLTSGPSCGSQVHRGSSDSSSSEALSSPTTLMAL